MTITPVRAPDSPTKLSRDYAVGRDFRGPSARIRWPVRLGLLAAGLALPLLLLELVLRVFGPIVPGYYRTGSFETAHPVYGRFHVPNFKVWVRNPEYIARITTNSIGLRDDDVAIPKPRGTYRILVVGDSYVEGEGVSDGQPFTEVMERALNARPGQPERYEVVNAGVGGWGPAREYLWLKNEGPHFEPDIVVVQVYLGNDIQDSGCKIQGRDKQKDKVCFYFNQADRLYQDEFRPRAPDPLDGLRNPFRQTTKLYNVLETGVFEKLDGDNRDGWKSQLGVYAKSMPRREQKLWDEAWRITAGLIKLMQGEAEGMGARFVLTAVPSVFYAYPELWEARAAANGLEPDRWDFATPNRRLAEVAGELGVSYLDLSPGLRREAAAASSLLFYQRDGHLTPDGHAVVARLLQEFLENRGLAR